MSRRHRPLLTSPRLAEALDLSREESHVRRQYGLDRAYPQEREGKTLLDQLDRIEERENDLHQAKKSKWR